MLNFMNKIKSKELKLEIKKNHMEKIVMRTKTTMRELSGSMYEWVRSKWMHFIRWNFKFVQIVCCLSVGKSTRIAHTIHLRNEWKQQGSRPFSRISICHNVITYYHSEETFTVSAENLYWKLLNKLYSCGLQRVIKSKKHFPLVARMRLVNTE